MVTRRPGYHAQSRCSSARLGLVGLGAGPRCRACVSGAALASSSAPRLIDRAVAPASDLRANPRVAAIPKCADSQTTGGREPDREGEAAVPIDLSRGCANRDVRANSPRRCLEPLGQFAATGDPWACFRNAFDSMCLLSKRSATSCFNRAFSSSNCRSRRSSLTPRWPYFFSQA